MLILPVFQKLIVPDAAVRVVNPSVSVVSANTHGSGTTITISSLDFGANDPNRLIAIVHNWGAAANRSYSSVTIGGVAGTLIRNTGSANSVGSGAYYAQPTGTTGQTVSITMSGSLSNGAYGIYRIIANSPVPYHSNDNGATGATGNTVRIALNMANQGVGILSCRFAANAVMSSSYDGTDTPAVDLNSQAATTFGEQHMTTNENNTRNWGWTSTTTNAKTLVGATWR